MEKSCHGNVIPWKKINRFHTQYDMIQILLVTPLRNKLLFMIMVSRRLFLRRAPL